MSSNDNDHPMAQDADEQHGSSHGRAALLLIESLIHGLCERSALSATEAVAIAERAVEVQALLAHAADGAGAPLWRSHALLSDIASSLKVDAGDQR